MLIVIALVYINAVSRPLLIDSSTMAADDVKNVGDAKIGAQKLANAVNAAAASGGESKKQVLVYLPEGTSISCDTSVLTDKKITYSATVSNQYCRAYSTIAEECNPAKTNLPCCEYCFVDAGGDETCGSACAAGGYFKCSGYIRLLSTANIPSCATSPTIIQGAIYKGIAVLKDSLGEISFE